MYCTEPLQLYIVYLGGSEHEDVDLTVTSHETMLASVLGR